jgi:epidermal growth factor receptor substrate 15
LSKIWELADTEQRGALVQTEFIIAMHLLTSMKIGAMRSLPNILPAALYEAATLRGPAAAPRQSPNNTGMSPIPRQMSGSAMQRTGSPLGRAPTIPVQHSGAAGGWAVTPADKARFDQIYSDIDKTNKGYIVGEEAVPFLSQSGLPEDTLAQIWDLADYNSSGQLTREGFAIAMFLIRQQRTGRSAPLPNTLPPNLIPPSMRNQQRQAAAASPFDAPAPSQPPPPTQPKPPPKSALDDLFGLDSTSSSPAPPAPAQMATATGGSMNDPFAGTSSPVAPSSPTRSPAAATSFKPFIPSSTFGRGLATQGTGDSQGTNQQSSQQSWHASNNDDLLSDNDPDASKNISGESTDLANLSHQVGSLSKQMQDTQAKRSNTQNELNQTNSQKANFEQRLAQLRTLYEKEASDTHALEEQLRNSRNDTKKLQGECMTLEGTYRDAQAQHQEILANLQADQKENTDLRERIRVINGEIAQLKPQIEKLKSEARQQRGLAAINKKQLSAVEGERDKLKNEAADLAKAAEEAPRQVAESSAGSTPMQVASPTLSTASGNNPFFRRTASTDIMGAVGSPPARTFSDKSFDDVFGPSPIVGGTSTPPPPATSFKPQTTGTSTASAASVPAPSASSTAAPPPPPPESRQMSSNFLPFPDHNDSLSSSRQVSPPASRAEGSENDATNPFPGPSPAVTGNLPGAFPSETEPKETPAAPMPTTEAEAEPEGGAEKANADDEAKAPAADPFGSVDQTKAKEDFENAFAAFTTANNGKSPAPPEAPKSSAFDSEFPPISELDRDESESDSEGGGFDDDFAPNSPRRSSTAPKPPPKVDEPAEATAAEKRYVQADEKRGLLRYLASRD